MSMTFCKINVKHVQDNKEIKIKYKLNQLTGVDTSYTARNRWVFNSLIKVTTHEATGFLHLRSRQGETKSLCRRCVFSTSNVR